MRINIVLDDDLIKEALQLSNIKTKKDVITCALQEFVSTRKRRNLLNLERKITFKDDYDYKAMQKPDDPG